MGVKTNYKLLFTHAKTVKNGVSLKKREESLITRNKFF